MEGFKGEKAIFKVEFLEKQRVCFKAKITDVVEPFRFVVNDTNEYSPSDVVTLKPGDV